MKRSVGIVIVELIVVSILLYLSGHYLKLIFKMGKINDFDFLWFGINVYGFMVDVCIYLAIGLLLFVIGIIIYEVDK